MATGDQWVTEPDPLRGRSTRETVVTVSTFAWVLAVLLTALMASAGYQDVMHERSPTARPTPTRQPYPLDTASLLVPPIQPWPTPSLIRASSFVDEGSFDLTAGTGVRLVDGDDEWTVAVLGIEWLAPCTSGLGTAPMVVVTIRVESLRGAVRVRPNLDFRFAGVGTPFGPTSVDCAYQPLQEASVTANNQYTGQLACTVVDGSGGEIIYDRVEPVASWTVPPRP